MQGNNFSFKLHLCKNISKLLGFKLFLDTIQISRPYYEENLNLRTKETFHFFDSSVYGKGTQIKKKNLARIRAKMLLIVGVYALLFCGGDILEVCWTNSGNVLELFWEHSGRIYSGPIESGIFFRYYNPTVSLLLYLRSRWASLRPLFLCSPPSSAAPCPSDYPPITT